MVVENKLSLFCKDGYSEEDVERNIFMNPLSGLSICGLRVGVGTSSMLSLIGAFGEVVGGGEGVDCSVLR